MVKLSGDEKSRYVATMFDRLSSRYDLLNTVMSFGMHHQWRKYATDVATRAGVTGEALDLATGTGDFALQLSSRPEVSRVVGLDFAPNMLQIAIKKAVRQRKKDRVSWIQGDAQSLPFSDNRFSCITTGFGLRNFSDMGMALREMVRVAKPDGRVVILDIVPIRGNNIIHKFKKFYFNRIVPKLGSVLAGDLEGYRYLPESVEHFVEPEGLVTLMEHAGLRNVSYRLMGFGAVAIHVGEK
jgi:demethylmenaquinone methyltransferase/2-methoxy-6-polyprenyl-1,4-benzoquinol methylase